MLDYARSELLEPMNRPSSQKQMRVLLLGATFDSGNMGVSALAAGAVRCVMREYPDADLALLDYREKPTVFNVNVDKRTVAIPVINIRFSRKIWLFNHVGTLLGIALLWKLLPIVWFRQWLRSLNPRLREIDNADVVVAISGGDSFSDIYGVTRFVYCALPQVLVLLIGKKLLLLPQTFGPYRTKMSRAMARYIVSGAAYVRARDYRSLDVLKRLQNATHLPPNWGFAYDLGLTIEPKTVASPKLPASLTVNPGKRPVVGLNVSGLLMMGGYRRNNMFSLKVQYRDLIEKLIRLFVEDIGAKVLLVPHVFSTDAESDVTACRSILESLSKKYGDALDLVECECDEGEIKYIIGQCTFFVGSRMHACIAAVSQSVPTIAIAYSDKFIGVMEALRVDSLVADARFLDEASLLNLIQKSYERRFETRDVLSARMPDIIQSALNLFAELSSRDGLAEYACAYEAENKDSSRKTGDCPTCRGAFQ